MTSLYTGQPSRSHEALARAASVVKALLKPVGGVLALVPLKIPFLTDGVPPFFLTRGLDVERAKFHGMPVLGFTPVEPTGHGRRGDSRRCIRG